MFGLTLIVIAIFSFAALAILNAVATHDPALLPATVNPFAVGTLDAANDTMPTGETMDGDWQMNEVCQLHEAEEMLDWLENHNIRHRELTCFGNKFQVRWR